MRTLASFVYCCGKVFTPMSTSTAEKDLMKHITIKERILQ